jgi:hypothetical protein
MVFRRFSLVLAAGLAGACQPGEEAERGEANTAAASAEGKAEEGRIAIKAPGFDLAINLPKEVADEARADRDNKLLYPGSSIRGIHIAAAPAAEGKDGSEVDMRFSSPDPVDTVLAWYRDPARAEGFTLEKTAREGESHLITGVRKRDGHRFKLRLSARAGGGTDGRLTVRHLD